MNRSDIAPSIEEPKLARSMGSFSSFAISMSTICILSGGITSFHVGFCSVGAASIGVGWPLEVLFALAVALTMAQVASAFPTAGGTYHWAYTLGGKGWGWVTACFSIAGLVTALAAVDVGLCQFVDSVAERVSGTRSPPPPGSSIVAVVLVLFSQAFINHHGMRLTSRLNDFAGYLIVVVAVLLTLAMVVFGILQNGFDLARLFTFTNYSGHPPGPNPIWPRTDNIFWLFALGLLLPAYTLTGFDASAQTSEETVNPTHAVPRGIVRAVLISGIAGWIVLSAVVLAAPDVDRAAEQGPTLLQLHHRRRGARLAAAAAAIYRHRRRPVPVRPGRGDVGFAHGLRLRPGRRHAAVALSAARQSEAAHAVAGHLGRGGGGGAFRASSTTRPSPPSAPSSSTSPMCCRPRSACWPTAEPGRAWAPGTSAAGIVPWPFCACWAAAGLIVIGLQPPNEIAIWVVGGSILVLAGIWFGYKSRHFPGPPQEILAQLRPSEKAM